MSIRVMTMVFDRYPEGGSERLLALALADHARDDGSRIWPSVAELGRKTLQSTRTVQRQIRRMVELGWLIPVKEANGRPGQTNEYRINPAWIAGGALPSTGVNLSPVEDEETGDKVTPVSDDSPVDNVIHTGVTGDATGDIAVSQRGDIAVSPESSGTIRNPSPLPPAEAGGSAKQSKPKPGSVPVLRTRDERNWQASRRGVEWMAGELGMEPWDPGPYGTGKTEMFPAFERRVVDEFVRRGGRLGDERRRA